MQIPQTNINMIFVGLFQDFSVYGGFWPLDDVIKWKPFPGHWHFMWGMHRSPVNSLHKGQWRRALMLFFFIRAWISGWINNPRAGDLRRYRAHYDVIVIPETQAGRHHCDTTSFRWTFRWSGSPLVQVKACVSTNHDLHQRQVIVGFCRNTLQRHLNRFQISLPDNEIEMIVVVSLCQDSGRYDKM